MVLMKMGDGEITGIREQALRPHFIKKQKLLPRAARIDKKGSFAPPDDADAGADEPLIFLNVADRWRELDILHALKFSKDWQFRLSLTKMKYIDAHAHIASWPTIKTTEGYLLAAKKNYHFSFTLLSNCDCASFPNEGQKGGVSTLAGLKQVVSFVKKNASSFGAGVWIKPLVEKEVSQELRDYIEKNRKYIYFLKLHPWCEKVAIDDPSLKVWLEYARELGLPVLVHTATDDYSSIGHLEKACDMYPDLSFVAAHLELSSDHLYAIEAMKRHPNMYADTAWVDMETAKKVITEVGESRIMFGTDNPVDGANTLNNPLYQEYRKNEKGLTPAQLRKLFSGNACLVYKIKI